MLAALGATSEEDRAYRNLLTVTNATLESVATATGLDVELARTALDGLVQRGLAYETDGRYEAAPPQVAERLIEDRISSLREAQSTIHDLRLVYREWHRAVDDVIEVISDADEAFNRTARIQAEATTEILALARLPIINVDPDDPGATATSLRVASRTVWDSEVLAQPGWLEIIEQHHWPRDEIRSYQGVPLKLLIVDQTVAMLPFNRGSDGRSSVAIVHGSVLLDALIALFESIWAAAAPLLIGPDSGSIMPVGSPLSAEEGRLLSLLLAGLTDEAIAAREGVSTRTIQRRVQALMTAAHARTRMQLAWHAGRSRWLS